MTGTVCSVTGEACQCARGGGCAAKRRAQSQLRIARHGLEGVVLTIAEVERQLMLDRPAPGPELREILRSLKAQAAALDAVVKGLDK